MPCSVPAGQLWLDALPRYACRAAVHHCHGSHRRARPHLVATSRYPQQVARSQRGRSVRFGVGRSCGKRGLLAKVIDWTLAGDDEPIPMAQRPSIIAIQQEPSIAGKCALHAHHTRMVAARIAQTLQMLRAAADADSDARAIYETGEAQRRTGAGLFVANLRRAGELRAGLSDEQAADAIWALSPDILWTLLVVQRDWTPGEFELWYAGQVAAAVLDDNQIPAARRYSHKLITTATPTSQRYLPRTPPTNEDPLTDGRR